MAAPAASLDLALNLPQWRASQVIAPRRTVFLGWGRGVGKSWFVRSQWYLLIAKWDGAVRSNALKPFKGIRLTVLMPTLVQFKDVHWSGIENELGPGGEWAFLGAKLDRQRGHITFPGGSWIKPFPASAYNARTARGMRCDVLSCDEYDDIDAAVYDAVAVPWLSEPWSLGIELLGGTPTRGRHGLWWRTLRDGRRGEQLRNGAEPESEDERALASIYAFHATYRDAPETVSPDAVRKARATTPAATFKREWEADPDAGEGLVYPFDEAFHVRKAPPLASFAEFVVGMDHGWVDPGVLLLIGIQGHGNDAASWVIGEWYEAELQDDVWDARAVEWGKKFNPTFWPDISRPSRIKKLRDLGLKVGEVDKNILAGISTVANLLVKRWLTEELQYARLYVDPGCKQTIREFGMYRRKKLPDGTFDEQPEDKDNHAMDALRYALVGRFGFPASGRQVVSGR
jgi:hypothetical protein